jgi:hypothetical protein
LGWPQTLVPTSGDSHTKAVSEPPIQFNFILQRVKEDHNGKTLNEMERKKKLGSSRRLRRKHCVENKRRKKQILNEEENRTQNTGEGKEKALRKSGRKV